jgi:hypothetical protein
MQVLILSNICLFVQSILRTAKQSFMKSDFKNSIKIYRYIQSLLTVWQLDMCNR